MRSIFQSRFHFVIVKLLQDNAAPATKRNPSYFADLDPKTMKLTELREELEARNLLSRGEFFVQICSCEYWMWWF